MNFLIVWESRVNSSQSVGRKKTLNNFKHTRQYKLPIETVVFMGMPIIKINGIGLEHGQQVVRIFGIAHSSLRLLLLLLLLLLLHVYHTF